MTTPRAASAPPAVLRRYALLVLRLSCLAMAVVSLLTVFARYHWTFDLLANLRIQLAIALILLLAAAVYLKEFKFVAVALLCLTFHTSVIANSLWTMTFVSSGPSSAKTRSIRLMTVNVLTRNRNYQTIADQIRSSDCDFVAVIELSDELDRFLKQDLADTHPHCFSQPDSMGNFGIGLYSKTQFVAAKTIFFSDGIPSIECKLAGLNIIATHPLPPMGAKLFESRNRHLQKLSKHIGQTSQQSGSHSVVMGDLNLTPWSPWFADFIRSSGLRRAADTFDVTPTWYARAGLFPMGLVLDHVLVGPDIVPMDYRVGPDIGSDHRSVSVTLKYPADRTTVSKSDR